MVIFPYILNWGGRGGACSSTANHKVALFEYCSKENSIPLQHFIKHGGGGG